MRTAIHSWSFRKRFEANDGFTIFDALRITADMGFSGIEIMTGKASSPPEHIGGDTPKHLAKVMAEARRLKNVSVDCLATYNDFAFVKNEVWRKANIEYIKQWLKIAGDLGVKNIRMLTGYYAEGQDRAHLEQITKQGIAECIPVAEAAGVNMAIENHNSIFMQADDIIGLIKQFGSKRLTACPDPSNWAREFFEPNCPADIHRGVLNSAAKLAPYATQSHLKIKGITPENKLAGFGDDLLTLLRSYHQAGYDGAITFESILDGEDLIGPLDKAKKIVDEAIRVVEAKGV